MPSFSTRGLSQALTFPFRDNKFLIACLVTFSMFLIPIVPYLALRGYSFRIMKRVLQEDGQLDMPEWDDWGQFLKDGLRLWGANLVYSLPLLVLWAGMFTLYALFMITLIAASAGRESDILAAFSVLGAFFPILMAVVMLVMLIFQAVLYFFLPAANAHLAAKDRFGAAFAVGEWGRVLKANFGGFAILFLLSVGGYMVFTFALQFLYMTLVLCALLPFVSAAFIAYATLVVDGLSVLLYREGLERQAAEADGSR